MSAPYRYIARMDDPIPEVKDRHQGYDPKVRFTLTDWRGDKRRVVSVTMEWFQAIELAKGIRRAINEKAKRLAASMEEE